LIEVTFLPILISSCLLGIECRYDGGHSRAEEIIEKAQEIQFIPICPEQLGGLSTPRAPSYIVKGDGKGVLSGHARVINSLGKDVTEAFIKGAQESLKLARLTGATKAILKNKSPSCGLNTPYCEAGTGYGLGITAALLLSAGITIIEINPEEKNKDVIEKLQPL
jgi:uncharacterized protein YbbK (DUF523 family)